MEEGVLILAIPGVFLLICVTVMLFNHFYYKQRGQNQISERKLTAKVSVINISNIAGNGSQSPTQKQKHPRGRRSRSNSPTRTNSNPKGKYLNVNYNQKYSMGSSVISLNENDCPPSYESLYDAFEYDVDKKQQNYKVQGGKDEIEKKQGMWLHPDSAKGMNYPGNYQNSYAVLYL